MTLGEFFERVAERYYAGVRQDRWGLAWAAAAALDEMGFVVLSREYYDTLIETGTLPEEN